MSSPKILLYLHHVELGQRYPISEDVIIGRLTGHILFPKDDRMSDKHCRIYLDPEGRLMIRDLESAHGTVVDGRLISPEKSYSIKEGSTIAVGAQVFKCVEPKKRPTPGRKRVKKLKRPEADFSMFYIVTVAAILFAAAMNLSPALHAQVYQTVALAKNWIQLKVNRAQPEPPTISSPFEIVYQEIQVAYEHYKSIGKQVRTGSMTSKTMAAEFRNSLIPKFQAAQAKLGVLKPSHELERQKIEANAKLVASVLNQITAMASFAETKNPKYSAMIEKATSEVEAANEEARRINRMPAGRN